MRQFRATPDVTETMILTCPSCSTRYQTGSAVFAPPGRNVRCAKCGHVWFQAAPGAEAELEPEPIAASIAAPVGSGTGLVAEATPTMGDSARVGAGPAVQDSMSPPVRRSRRFSGAALAQSAGWTALIFLIAALGWASVQYRQTIAGVWPQSASLYAAVGLPVNVRGIELTNISYQQEYQDGQPVLSVTGKVVNISNRELPVPEIRVVLLDDAKHELYHWNFDAGIPTLKPGGESTFVTRLSSPPPEARNLNVRFAESGDAR
jgi:predicted Zn finger-like uncharacterized protein